MGTSKALLRPVSRQQKRIFTGKKVGIQNSGQRWFRLRLVEATHLNDIYRSSQKLLATISAAAT